ncbi:MAG: prolipoprotein diacylglyceryl transferase [Anaerolineae bacterium]|nr:prolipoprotein diacylglyceryl transferase [Anaerolineae bacterium]
MSPQVYQLGFVSVRAFVFWIALGTFLCIALLLILAYRRRERLIPYLDLALAAILLAIPFARLGHVTLNWNYFSAHSREITNIAAGGLDWHGALFGALLGVGIVGGLRKLNLKVLLDRLALLFPILAATVWIACATSNAAYGIEVRTLADFPSLIVVESPDVYGIVAPRLALVTFGVLLAVAVMVILLIAHWSGWLYGGKLWIALILYGIGMALIGFFRAEYVPIWLGRRADQILDVFVVVLATILLVIGRLWHWRRASSASASALNEAKAGAVVS